MTTGIQLAVLSGIATIQPTYSGKKGREPPERGCRGRKADRWLSPVPVRMTAANPTPATARPPASAQA